MDDLNSEINGATNAIIQLNFLKGAHAYEKKKLKEQEEEEFVPKAFQKNKKDKNIEQSRGKKRRKQIENLKNL